jgi:membrane protease YdiL (CAAX protease family)
MPFEMAGRGEFLGRLLGYIGAGVYEEMLFRLMLIPPLAIGIKHFGVPRPWSVATVVLVTSAVFSAAHYIGPHGDMLDASTFVFRFTAGALFAVLFVYRGFGVAAGTHALYDIFVSLS